MEAGVSAQSASMHLAQLLQGGFLKVRQEGRHRYYSIAKPEVAHAIETLGAISTPQKFIPNVANKELCYARTCYDHLAGELAVRLTSAMERKRLLIPTGEREYELTPACREFLREWKIDVDELQGSRRKLARRCLDWTERKDHLAGALGAALCQRWMDLKWMTRDRRSRAVHVSRLGERELARILA